MSRFGVVDYYWIIHIYFCSHIVYLKYSLYISIVKQTNKDNMTTQELKTRLVKNQEILVFVNDHDVFEFSFSVIRGGKFRIMKNGSFTHINATLTRIQMCIGANGLTEE